MKVSLFSVFSTYVKKYDIIVSCIFLDLVSLKRLRFVLFINNMLMKLSWLLFAKPVFK